MKISLGPVLYYWDRKTLLDFYARAAETSVARGRNLKESMAATREVMDPKFSSFAIYEHCLPFNVSRAFDEASGIDDPVIWTDKRDQEMWAALQGGG